MLVDTGAISTIVLLWGMDEAMIHTSLTSHLHRRLMIYVHLVR
jgi:hypothetical protein